MVNCEDDWAVHTANQAFTRTVSKTRLEVEGQSYWSLFSCGLSKDSFRAVVEARGTFAMWVARISCLPALPACLSGSPVPSARRPASPPRALCEAAPSSYLPGLQGGYAAGHRHGV